MISLKLSVREAMNLATNCNLEIYEKIMAAFETALGEDERRTITITGGMTTDNRIACIKAIRLHAGWGLKEAKDWTDCLVGGWVNSRWVESAPGANKSITLRSPEAAENLLRDLTSLGCEGFLS